MDPMRRPDRPTLDDVASIAGVSRASASRALRGQSKVTPETVRRVKDAAARIGYIPNAAARLLAGGGEPGLLGLIVRDSSNPAYFALQQGIQAAARQRNERMIAMSIANGIQPELAESIIQSLLGLGVGGLIVATAAVPSEILERYHSVVPLLRAGTPEPSPVLHSVSYDEASHARLVAAQIADHGHRSAVVVSLEPRALTQYLRADCLDRELTARGVTVRRVVGDFSRNCLDQVLGAVRAGATAVACADDAWALDVLAALADEGLRTPEDVSVTGIDGIMTGLDLIDLTTVRLPVEALAEAATDAIQRIVAASGPVARIDEKTGGELVLRGSLGAAPPAG